jgi:hypothetical protein
MRNDASGGKDPAMPRICEPCSLRWSEDRVGQADSGDQRAARILLRHRRTHTPDGREVQVREPATDPRRSRYFGFNEPYKAYIGVMSFDRLVNAATAPAARTCRQWSSTAPVKRPSKSAPTQAGNEPSRRHEPRLCNPYWRGNVQALGAQPGSSPILVLGHGSGSSNRERLPSRSLTAREEDGG